MTFCLTAFILLLLLCGCVRQEAALSFVPSEAGEEQGTGEESLSAALTVEPVTGTPPETDSNGIPLSDPDTHYFRYYLSFSDIRIYEEEGYTFLDGFCLNSFDSVLSGACDVIFYDDSGSACGLGTLHTADGDSLLLQPGQNRIYAEILSEDTVKEAAFSFAVTAAFAPVAQ